MTDRLFLHEHGFIAQCLKPLNDERLAQLYLTYGGDIPAADNHEFIREVGRWKERWANVDVNDRPVTLTDALVSIADPILYQNVFGCMGYLCHQHQHKGLLV